MKAIISFALALSIQLAALLAAPQVIAKDDVAAHLNSTGIALADGHTFYAFAANGEFISGPLEESGRTMKGHWTIDPITQGGPAKVIVIAEQGWINGTSMPGDFRKIVFIIYPGQMLDKPMPKKTDSYMELPRNYTGNYTGYWFIDEMSKTAAPKKPTK